jgi:thiamine-monophosphate kinase
VDIDALPRSPAFHAGGYPAAWAASGGDDYELLFTVDPAHETALQTAARHSNTLLTRIGYIEEASGLRWVNHSGAPVTVSAVSFEHF